MAFTPRPYPGTEGYGAAAVLPFGVRLRKGQPALRPPIQSASHPGSLVSNIRQLF